MFMCQIFTQRLTAERDTGVRTGTFANLEKNNKKR